MSMNSGAGNDTAELMSHLERINLGNHHAYLQSDANGHVFCSSGFFTSPANGNRAWRWKLLRSGDELFHFCIEPLSDRAITLSSVQLCGLNRSSGTWAVLTEKEDIGQPSYRSGDFSVANSMPDFDEAFRGNHGNWIDLLLSLSWAKTAVSATPIPMSSDCLLEGLYSRAMDGGEKVYELVSSDGQSLPVNVTILKAKSAYFKRFFATDGWKEQIELEWTKAEVNAAPIPVNPVQPCVLEHQYNKVVEGGDSAFELVASDDQSFRVSVAIFEDKSAYFQRFFATEGWKEQSEGQMVLAWTSAVVKQLIRYVYLNTVDGDVCELLPDILDAAQMWELVGMKAVIKAQMRERLQKAARDADTDMAAAYLKMAHLHSLASLVPLCNGVLADNFDHFFDSESCKQMINSSEFSHLVKALFHHK